MSDTPSKPLVAIACGGTGGHVFPGIAVGRELEALGCDVTLWVSQKRVDQQAVADATGLIVRVLPAVGLSRGGLISFCSGFWQSLAVVRKAFRERAPGAVLGMGGFTSAAPIIAGKLAGAKTFLHESNCIPGRANKRLSGLVDEVFVGFAEAAERFGRRAVSVTGTPVRPKFRGLDAVECRKRLGLNPEHPVLLVMGGSQGASAINRIARELIPRLAAEIPGLQFIHLSGEEDLPSMQERYTREGIKVKVCAFLLEMELAMGAATLALSRAGASSLAELAATRLPSILMPYPQAVDDHQTLNARAFERTGAAVLLPEIEAATDKVEALVLGVLQDEARQLKMRGALEALDHEDSSRRIAGAILARAGLDTLAKSSSESGVIPKPTHVSGGFRCAT